MGIQKILSLESFREFLKIAASLHHGHKQATDVQLERINLPYVKDATEKIRPIPKLTRQDPVSALKTLNVKYFVNLKIESLHKIKTTTEKLMK